MSPSTLDFQMYEETLLAMILFKPAVINQIQGELFDSPGNYAVLETMRSMCKRGEEITKDSVQQAAGLWAHYVPEPWFTVANIGFYLKALKRRRQLKVRRAELQDELTALDNEGIVA